MKFGDCNVQIRSAPPESISSVSKRASTIKAPWRLATTGHCNVDVVVKCADSRSLAKDLFDWLDSSKIRVLCCAFFIIYFWNQLLCGRDLQFAYGVCPYGICFLFLREYAKNRKLTSLISHRITILNQSWGIEKRLGDCYWCFSFSVHRKYFLDNVENTYGMSVLERIIRMDLFVSLHSWRMEASLRNGFVWAALLRWESNFRRDQGIFQTFEYSKIHIESWDKNISILIRSFLGTLFSLRLLNFQSKFLWHWQHSIKHINF